MTYGPGLIREHRTADHLPGRLALSLLRPHIKVISYF
jgi:hypothetical protein